jgi:hypothetical protein
MLRIQFGRGVAVSLPCLVSLCRLCRFDVDRCRPPPFAVVSLLLSFDDGLECYNLSAKVSVVSLTQKHEPMSFTSCAYSPWNRLTSHRTLSAAPFLCVRRLSRERRDGASGHLQRPILVQSAISPISDSCSTRCPLRDHRTHPSFASDSTMQRRYPSSASSSVYETP